MSGDFLKKGIHLKKILDGSVYLTKDELAGILRDIRFDCFTCSSKTRKCFLGLRFPAINSEWPEYQVNYVSCEKDNKYSFRMNYDMTFSENDFVNEFAEMFSELKTLDLSYVAKKIWSISKHHASAYRSFTKIDVDKASNEYYSLLSNSQKYDIRNLPDENVNIKDIFVSKTFAQVKGAVLALVLGTFTLNKGNLVRNGERVLLGFTPKYSRDFLTSCGLQFDDPKNMGGWRADVSMIDTAVRTRRSIYEDIELYLYLAKNIDKCP